LDHLTLSELQSIEDRFEVGHPDTICDALADALSRALCRKYWRRFDNILHHNDDKALMLGDEPRADS